MGKKKNQGYADTQTPTPEYSTLIPALPHDAPGTRSARPTCAGRPRHKGGGRARWHSTGLRATRHNCTQPHTHRGARRRGPYHHGAPRHSRTQQPTQNLTLRHQEGDLRRIDDFKISIWMDARGVPF